MKIFKNGLITGLTLQLAIGPVFFFIINLALQRSVLDGLVGATAVTIVDYFYIALAVLGIGKLLQNNKFKKLFGVTSSVILVIFGIIITRSIASVGISNPVMTPASNLFSSFVSVFLLTISNPITIVFFTSLFTAKAVEYNYTKKDLILFSLGTGLATLIFMGTSVIVFSLIKGAVPVILIQILNITVGCLLVGYGGIRLIKLIWNKT